LIDEIIEMMSEWKGWMIIITYLHHRVRPLSHPEKQDKNGWLVFWGI
jgi:hypothetical protein